MIKHRLFTRFEMAEWLFVPALQPRPGSCHDVG